MTDGEPWEASPPAGWREVAEAMDADGDPNEPHTLTNEELLQRVAELDAEPSEDLLAIADRLRDGGMDVEIDAEAGVVRGGKLGETYVIDESGDVLESRTFHDRVETAVGCRPTNCLCQTPLIRLQSCDFVLFRLQTPRRPRRPTILGLILGNCWVRLHPHFDKGAIMRFSEFVFLISDDRLIIEYGAGHLPGDSGAGCGARRDGRGGRAVPVGHNPPGVGSLHRPESRWARSAGRPGPSGRSPHGERKRKRRSPGRTRRPGAERLRPGGRPMMGRQSWSADIAFGSAKEDENGQNRRMGGSA